jgi:hypothetical protein
MRVATLITDLKERFGAIGRLSAIASLYGLAAGFALAVALAGAWRVATVLAAHTAAAPVAATPAKSRVPETPWRSAQTGPVDRAAFSRRDVNYTPTAERYAGSVPRSDRLGDVRRAAVGGSSRNSWQRRWRDDDDEDDEPRFEEERRPPPPQPVQTFRTLCVRLCDGYYFPISNAVTRDKLALDAAKCQARCGSEARLFVQAGFAAKAEQMLDLQGKTYASLPTAFLYRTQYLPACKCQPEPWSQEAALRHQGYADAAKLALAPKAPVGTVVPASGTGAATLPPAPAAPVVLPVGLPAKPVAVAQAAPAPAARPKPRLQPQKAARPRNDERMALGYGYRPPARSDFRDGPSGAGYVRGGLWYPR